jgi:hypothetical protein
MEKGMGAECLHRGMFLLAEGLKTSSPRDLKTSSPRDLKTSSPRDLKTSSPRDLKKSHSKKLKDRTALKKSNTTMNITTNNVEVSTPFFHENNTTMNTYEAPVQSGLAETASLVEPEKSKSIQWCPCEAAQSEAAQSEAAQSNPEQSSLAETASLGENTIFHMFQASISRYAHRKQYNEECPFQVGVSHPDCKIISDNIEREHEKIEKGRAIAKQFFTPKRFVEDTNPVPWRWENRTAILLEGGVWGERKSQIFYQGHAAEGGGVSPQQRGACLLYRPVTYKMTQPTPFCLLHENDVVDNGTVMCLKARWDECVYGNETMKAILEIDTFYRSEIKFPEIKFPEFPEMSQTTWFVLIVLFFFFVGTLQRSV